MRTEKNEFKCTIFREKRNGSGETSQAVAFNVLIDSMKSDTKDGRINKYRSCFSYMDTPEKSDMYKRIPRLCAATEYYRDKSGKRVFRAYNGVSMVKITDLCTSLELEKAKKQVAMLPQTLCAFNGVDNHSVVALTLSTLPDGTLPKTEEAAQLFAAKAYITSVQCLQPLIEFRIDIEQPLLDVTCKVTVDEQPYVNAFPVPFIIEQPTKVDLKVAEDKASTMESLKRMAPGGEQVVTYLRVFNAAYHRALHDLGWNGEGRDEKLIATVADLCADGGLPQEETTVRLHSHFCKMNIDDVRAIVKNVYETKDGIGGMVCMNRHQMIAYRLKEFLNRRYDIRFNEVLQMTEFRERYSFRFLYRELTKRELNTIYHEAQIEGISPTFGEVDSLVHSTLIPQYNPVEDYLNHLPAWDGKDRITQVAKMVPTDNVHWERLFRQWFLSMVAHWMNGDEKHANSTAPILIGAQGYRKSTFCRQLLPPELQLFYTDSIDFRTNIEAERSLSRFLIINVDEFDQLTEKQFAFVKHLFQKPATNIRRMYSEAIATQRRYASFIGTTNCDEVLRDPTGNRRYLCVMVTDKIRTEEVIDHHQLYAQAVHLITNGTRYWLNDEDEALIKQTNARFEVQSPLEANFLTCFAPVGSEDDGEWFSSTQIMEVLMTLPTFNKRMDNNIMKLSKVLTKHNVIKRRQKAGNMYFLKKLS